MSFWSWLNAEDFADELEPTFAPDVIMRNNLHTSDILFKEQAVEVIAEMSNLDIVAAWDDDPAADADAVWSQLTYTQQIQQTLINFVK